MYHMILTTWHIAFLFQPDLIQGPVRDDNVAKLDPCHTFQHWFLEHIFSTPSSSTPNTTKAHITPIWSQKSSTCFHLNAFKHYMESSSSSSHD
jgi:hypothetical protein